MEKITNNNESKDTTIHSFINEQSVKCLLGKNASNFRIADGAAYWSVGERNHFCVFDKISDKNIEYLKEIKQSNFHYLSINNIEILKKEFKVERSKEKSIILQINDINYSGRKMKTIRNYMNRYKYLEICNNYKNISDVSIMINRWSDTLADKYFRDFSGKNLYFLNNNYHIGGNCIFIYDKDKLVSFGVASSVIGGRCSYIIGKALCRDYPGLSEFTDMKLYEQIFEKNGVFEINTGQAVKGLVFYKEKFPNSREEVHYNGKFKI